MKGVSSYIRSVDLKKAVVGLRTDAIVETHVFRDEELSVDDVKEIIEAIAKIGERQMLPQLIVADPLASIDVLAMNYLATAESSPYAIAEAYVISSLAQKIIARFYLSFNKPARPTKMFGQETEAVRWLQEQTRLYHQKTA